MTPKEKSNYRELARLCKTRTEFARRFNSEYQRIMRLGLADELFSHMPKPFRWSREALAKIARRYKTRSEWLADSPSTFQSAHRMGVIDEIGPKSRRGKAL